MRKTYSTLVIIILFTLLGTAKSKSDRVYKLYFDGRFYKDRDDPEGKNCPIPWKWVNNTKESDIIGLSVLDHLKIIKNIENYKYDKNRQKLILMSRESPINYNVMLTKKKYFDYSMDFRLDSDSPRIYIPLSNFTKSPFPTAQKRENNRPLVAAFISNCKAKNNRLEYLKELMKYMKVDSYGKCLHNKDQSKNDIGRNNFETKMNIIRKYKFTLAFENSNYRDYVTEKFFQPLVEGSVPIYMGAPNIDYFAPENSYIDIRKYKDPKELAKYLNYLDKNNTAYEQYLNWKKKALEGDLGENINRLLKLKKLNPTCQLLQRINNMWINPFLTIWNRKDVPNEERACILC